MMKLLDHSKLYQSIKTECLTDHKYVSLQKNLKKNIHKMDIFMIGMITFIWNKSRLLVEIILIMKKISQFDLLMTECVIESAAL